MYNFTHMLKKYISVIKSINSHFNWQLNSRIQLPHASSFKERNVTYIILQRNERIIIEVPYWLGQCRCTECFHLHNVCAPLLPEEPCLSTFSLANATKWALQSYEGMPKVHLAETDEDSTSLPAKIQHFICYDRHNCDTNRYLVLHSVDLFAKWENHNLSLFQWKNLTTLVEFNQPLHKNFVPGSNQFHDRGLCRVPFSKTTPMEW